MNGAAIGWPAAVYLQARELLPGLLATVVVALAATFLSQHYGSPVMLFALLIGMAMNYLSSDGRCVAGIDFVAKHVLRAGVALLGLRITATQVSALGWHCVLLVAGSVAITIGFGILAARLHRHSSSFGLLTGGAVAICGASAAMALAAALPRDPLHERNLSFTIIGVSTLSTLAMVVYPVIVHAVGMTPAHAGIFLGGTIHDVAQVVGAGYGMSPATGDAATVVKLLRVSMLLPVILFAVLFTRARGGECDGERPPLLPWFAIAFAVLLAVNSTGWIPAAVRHAGIDLSQGFLAAAMVAIGMKTRLKELATVGWKPVTLMIAETVCLAALVLAGLRYL